MMQGITTLPGAQQQQAPGQAAPMKAPPQGQTTATPMAMVTQLSQLPSQQLLQLYQNPMLLEGSRFSLSGVIGAMSERLKRAAQDKAMQNDAVQAAYGQQAQQPPVAQQLAAAFQAKANPSVMAAHGGIMHGYSGGGAVAFERGGAVQKFSDGSEVSEAESPFGRAVGRFGRAFSEQNEISRLRNLMAQKYGPASALPGLFMTQTDAQRERAKEIMRLLPTMSIEQMRNLLGQTPPRAVSANAFQEAGPGETGMPVAAPAEAPERLRDTRAIPASAVRPAGAGAAPAPAAAPATPPATPDATGLGALIAAARKRVAEGSEAQLGPLRKQLEENAQAREALFQRMQATTPEEQAARDRYYAALEGAYAPQRKSLEAAQAATREGLASSPEALLRMAAAVSQQKRFGQALGAAAGSAGEILGERRKRAEQLEERYQTLTSQLGITMAQARRADVEGDEKRKRELLLQAQGIKDKLVQDRLELIKTGSEIGARDLTGLTGLLGAQAQMTQASKPTEFQQKLALFRSDPKTYEAMFGSREAQQLTRVQQAVNADPALKELAKGVSMGLPDAEAKYNARYNALVAQLAPELLLGAGGRGTRENPIKLD